MTHLLIEIPDRINITNHITIIDQQYRAVDFVTYFTSTNLTIEFTQPILPGQILSVAIHGISSSARSSQTWIYSLYGKKLEHNFTLLGIARIITYRSPK
jgi:hypothetical protein